MQRDGLVKSLNGKFYLVLDGKENVILILH